MSVIKKLWSDPSFVERIQKVESAKANPASVSQESAPNPPSDYFRRHNEKPATDDQAKKLKLTLTEDDLAKIPQTVVCLGVLCPITKYLIPKIKFRMHHYERNGRLLA